MLEGGIKVNKKEKMDLLLSKVEEGKKDAFVAELREAKSKEERFEVFKKYDATLTEEEVKAIKAADGNELNDEELDQAAGGCSCVPQCECYCSCSCF